MFRIPAGIMAPAWKRMLVIGASLQLPLFSSDTSLTTVTPISYVISVQYKPISFFNKMYLNILYSSFCDNSSFEIQVEMGTVMGTTVPIAWVRHAIQIGPACMDARMVCMETTAT